MKVSGEHLVAIPTHQNRACARVYGECGQLSWRNVALSATFELDWPIHDFVWNERSLYTAGCGFGGGATLFQGDLADRERLQLGLTIRFGMNLAVLGVE